MPNSKDQMPDRKSPQMGQGRPQDKAGSKQQDQSAPKSEAPGRKQQGSDQRRDQQR